jgi:hypothetical protein
MSLRLRGSVLDVPVKTGFTFQVPYSSVEIDVNRFPTIVIRHDLMMYLLHGGFSCFYGSMPLSSIFGLSGYEGSEVRLNVSHRPVNSLIDQDHYDGLTYGNFSHGLQLFESTLTGRTSNLRVGRENYCRHSTFSGELIPGIYDLLSGSSDFDFFGYHYPVGHQSGYLKDRGVITSVSPLGISIQSANYGGNYDRNVLDLLSALVGVEVHSTSLSNGIWLRTLSGLSYDVSDKGLWIRYHIYVQQLTDEHDVYSWDSVIHVPFASRPRDRSPVVGASVNAAYTAPVTYMYLNGFTTYSGGPVGSLDYMEVGSGSYQSFPYVLQVDNGASTVHEGSEWVDSLASTLRSKRFLIDFERRVGEAWGDIIPSSLFSTTDAFLASEGSLNTNVLQTLAKIPAIVDALPKLREGADLLGRLVGGRVDLMTLKELLDLATSTHLQAVFEWRPYLDLFTRYLPQLASVMRSLGQTSERAISYGSFRFKIISDLGRDEVTLLTRTKLVMDTSSSGLLSAILGADALGVIPKPSNVWDLIPFSFLVNWFLGLGSAMRRAEYSLLLANIPAYYVHSYLLTSPLSQPELALLKAASSPGKTAVLRLFYRDWSIYTPFPRDSRFGFGIPTGIPSVGSFGSLLYQLLFG